MTPGPCGGDGGGGAEPVQSRPRRPLVGRIRLHVGADHDAATGSCSPTDLRDRGGATGQIAKIVEALVPSAAASRSDFKNIRETALQPLHDLLEPAECDALVAILQPMQR